MSHPLCDSTRITHWRFLALFGFNASRSSRRSTKATAMPRPMIEEIRSPRMIFNVFLDQALGQPVPAALRNGLAISD
jgi:hypothetical protein